MQTRHRLAPILPLSVLGSLALVCGLSGPVAAQDNTQTTTTTQTTTQQTSPTTTVTQTTTTQTTTQRPDYGRDRDREWNMYNSEPEAPRYPEWAPGTINMFHWTDWTHTDWAPGSTYGVQLDRMKAEREFWSNMDKNGEMTTYYQPGYPSDYQTQTYYYREEAPPAGPAFYGGEAMAASGDFVYTVEDNTLYQLRASDLSLVTQQNLPAATDTNMRGGESVAASGSFVYMLRGNTLYQFRTSDLSQANTATIPAPTNPPPVGRRMRGMGRHAVAASGDYVFVRRDGTLYQFRASDLSLVTQTPMPIPNATTPTAPPAGSP